MIYVERRFDKRRYDVATEWTFSHLLDVTHDSNSTTRSHAMLREIYEQPGALRETISRHVSGGAIFPALLENVAPALNAARKIIIAASGSSRHAGLAGEIMIEDLACAPVDVEYSSEYCYRSTHAGSDPVVMAITQSGETADTIAAQREALARGARTIAICNVAESTIARESSATLLTHAGPEIAVPATKSFTTQLAVLYLFALFLARQRGRLSVEEAGARVSELHAIAARIEQYLPMWDVQAERFAQDHLSALSFLYLGRGVHYAIAREGALKLKEVSYVHAEGYPTGELKHGPQALISEGVPLVALVSHDMNDPDSMLRYRKSLGTLADARRNGATILAVANEGDVAIGALAEYVWYVPATPELLLPLLEIIPLQLFAYYMAVLNGHDVDHPRNLAKSVVRE